MFMGGGAKGFHDLDVSPSHSQRILVAFVAASDQPRVVGGEQTYTLCGRELGCTGL